MAKRQSNSLSKDDYCYEENVEEIGFDSYIEPIGECVSSFNFSSDPSTDLLEVKIPTLPEIDLPIKVENKKLPFGLTPPVDGEFYDIKRGYMLRQSTVRKLNELKAMNPDLNAYVSTIVDAAVCYYYEHTVNCNISNTNKSP